MQDSTLPSPMTASLMNPGFIDQAYTDRDREPSQQFMTFSVEGQEYGVDIMAVREIRGWTQTTALPHVPAHVRGVINLRGIVVPVFDLRARFGLGLTQPGKMHVIIIVKQAARTVGLLVDAVCDIISVRHSDIRPVPDICIDAAEGTLEGLVTTSDHMVTLISLPALFSDDGLASERQAAPEHA